MAPSKSPIRVGLIGLSAGGGWAPAAHLPYLQNSSKYTITAVCNSSLESGRKALEQYNLDSAKPYDSVESMCDSDTVDLVVCVCVVVVVFSHYKLVKPALERGKDVYVEWPLCATTAESKELADLARERGEVLESGRIGRVLGSHIVGSSLSGETGNRADRRYLYFKERHAEGVEGNGQVALSIYTGHTMDFVASLLGQPVKVAAQLQTTWPYVDIVDGDKEVERGVRKTADDYASLQGVTDTGVKYTYVLRGGDSFEPGDGLVWDIIGEKGQIRVTGASIMFNIGADNYEIRVKDYETGVIETVPLHENLPLPLFAQNVGMVYERLADGGFVPAFEDVVRRHEFLDAMFTSNEDGGAVQKLRT
ncbi:hypothetical protein BJY01DRAFT_253265 [Aspergillus pseudoustus]|uniref:Gfo/Idh/MocA-like oxidoreductase N-terminal domain-containing protein n=1 Tax=Aspergillus pseudoustus TaxID=1810923 RepID=A0ABR4J4T4_9EURO